MACLFGLVEELARPCKKAVADHRKRISADLTSYVGMDEACMSDRQRICGTVNQGGGRLHKCLREHKAEIASVTCKHMVDEVELTDRTHASINVQTRVNCAHEMETFCVGVQPGKSRLLTCLGMYANSTGFSQECRAALAETDVASMIKSRLKEKFSVTIDEFDAFMRRNQGFVSRNGGILLGLAVGATFFLSFVISYVCLKRKRKKTMYTVSYPNTPEDNYIA